MTTPPLDLEAYLQRVGLPAAVEPTPEGLARVHAAQLLAIPFENLDIHLGRGIRLDAESVHGKLLGRRGGYCFECNRLLRDALVAMGFHAWLALGRVVLHPAADAAGAPLRARTHAVVLASFAAGDTEGAGDRDCWLADAGFGGPNPRTPIRLGPADSAGPAGPAGAPAPPAARWDAAADAAHGWRIRDHHAEPQPLDLYTVEPAAAHPADLALGNHWTSTHPESSFTRRPIIVRHVAGGRVSLDGDRLVDRTGARPIERTIDSAAELEQVIREVMEIDPAAGPVDYERLLAVGRAASAAGPHPGA